MQCALAALMANGFRPSTNEPGHQQTMIQALPKTMGLPADRMKILDGFRRARNLSDYEGEPVEDAKVRECVEWADALLANIREWLNKNQSDLLYGPSEGECWVLSARCEKSRAEVRVKFKSRSANPQWVRMRLGKFAVSVGF